MVYVIVGLLAMLLYTGRVNFGHPLSVALWCVVMLVFWAAVAYGGMVYVISACY